ncbi:MAG: hypothetical protein RI988_508 [Pseudomonadota bacterium]|jgi:uncharacterized protein (DUF58 family)
MGATWGWALAVVAVAAGYVQWGWQGVVLAVTMIAFWLLLQFNRALRVMRQAGAAPVGHVGSAVMLHARLRRGMRLMEVIPISRSLGRAVEPDPAAGSGFGAREAFVWGDDSGACVRVDLVGGRVVRWVLQRPEEGVPSDAPAPSAPV